MTAAPNAAPRSCGARLAAALGIRSKVVLKISYTTAVAALMVAGGGQGRAALTARLGLALVAGGHQPPGRILPASTLVEDGAGNHRQQPHLPDPIRPPCCAALLKEPWGQALRQGLPVMG